MYISYNKLWKLLIDKNLSKTDLASLTGINSRVMAKLAKSETVTTETVARICEALGCDVGDIMEFVSEKRLSLYALEKRAQITERYEHYTVSRLEVDGVKYNIYKTVKKAGKGSRIHCRENGTVYWEQFYLFGGMSQPQREEFVLMKPKCEAGECTIVVISGKPAMIIGLDECGFVSAKGARKNESDIYVMSEAAFKIFEIKQSEEI